MLSDENENFVRDIEIKATQTFLDFHNTISDCVKLEGNELASFHICDQKWQKLEEITLEDMGEDVQENNKAIAIVAAMKDAAIRDHIAEPNQRLLYEYDFLNMKTFFIELISVFKQKEEGHYPRCTFKRGEVIDEFKEGKMMLDDDLDLRQQLFDDFEDMIDDTLEGSEDQDF
jgi:hypothetical protein